MRKTFILDTSALIHNPSAWAQYSHSDIIIPMAVLNELDKLKKQAGEVGKNARVCIRLIDELSDKMDITTGVIIDQDILVKVDAEYRDISNPLYAGFGDPTYGDSQILACAYDNWSQHLEHDVTLISNDINLRIKAKSRGIDAISNLDQKQETDYLYTGSRTIVDEDAGLNMQQLGFINDADYEFNLLSNECVFFQNEAGDGIALGRKTSNDRIKLIKKCYPWGLSARNKEQSFAIDLIMDKNIDLVTLTGPAGTGKSILVLAAALELVCSKKEYDKLIIYRPIQPVGNDIGYMPGDKSEKLAPWFQAIMDNLEVLLSVKNGKGWRDKLEFFQDKDQIEMDALTYIRGRSIPNSIIFLDEGQNISKEDMKTILTRAGENTKIILTGDLDQIDNNNLDAINNGLTYVIEKFKDSELAGHITFTQGERSRLATLAAEIL